MRAQYDENNEARYLIQFERRRYLKHLYKERLIFLMKFQIRFNI